MKSMYHYNEKTGKSGKCSAQVKDCPLGQSKDEHGTSREEAVLNYMSLNPNLIKHDLTKDPSSATLQHITIGKNSYPVIDRNKQPLPKSDHLFVQVDGKYAEIRYDQIYLTDEHGPRKMLRKPLRDTSPSIIDFQPGQKSEITYWTEDGKLLSGDGVNPTLISPQGEALYIKDGVLHREGSLPAYTFPGEDGTGGGESYWVNGKLHRDDGPAEVVFRNQEYDEEDLNSFYRHGKLHNLYGPATTYGNVENMYFVDGEELSEDGFWELEKALEKSGFSSERGNEEDKKAEFAKTLIRQNRHWLK